MSYTPLDALHSLCLGYTKITDSKPQEGEYDRDMYKCLFCLNNYRTDVIVPHVAKCREAQALRLLQGKGKPDSLEPREDQKKVKEKRSKVDTTDALIRNGYYICATCDGKI